MHAYKTDSWVLKISMSRSWWGTNFSSCLERYLLFDFKRVSL